MMMPRLPLVKLPLPPIVEHIVNPAVQQPVPLQ